MLAAAIHSTVSSDMDRVPPSVSSYIYALKQSNYKQIETKLQQSDSKKVK
jgi:hypothetical protein